MRIRHIWEGESGNVTIRVEQWRAFFRARTCLFVNGALAVANDSSLSMVRLVGESNDKDGLRDVVATVRSDGWSSADNLVTVTHDGRGIAMRVVQTRWLSAQPGWLRGLFVLGFALLAIFGGDLTDNRWIEYSTFAACLVALFVADAAPVYPSKRQGSAGH